jgi:ABC-2 type transport system permease protein
MLHLLKIEWLKVKNYRTFWILSALFLISIFGINYIAFNVQQKIYTSQQAKGMAGMILGAPPYSFPTTWQMTSYMSGFLLFIPGLLMIISVTNEYSYKTHRQNIIDGLSRTQFILIKMMLAVIAAFVSTMMVFFTALSFGFIDGTEGISFANFQSIPYFFIQALSFSSVALLISILCRRSGIAIGVYFLYSVILENLCAGLLNHYADYSGRYLPLQATDNLIPFPVFRSAQKQFIPEANIYVLLFLSALYLAAYFFIIKRKFETDDL